MRTKIYSDTFMDLSLNCTEKGHDGYYHEILSAIHNLLIYMVRKHCKVYLVRFDLRYPVDYSQTDRNDNSIISQLFEALIVYQKRHGIDAKYFWVRERLGSARPHYHCMLLLDGNKVQNAYGILERTAGLWCRALGIDQQDGFVQLVKPWGKDNQYGGRMIFRNSPNFGDDFQKCFEWCSYLAKCYSKYDHPVNANMFGCSRIPAQAQAD